MQSPCIHHRTSHQPYPRSKPPCLSRLHRSRAHQRNTQRDRCKDDIARKELVKVCPFSRRYSPTGLPCGGLPLDRRGACRRCRLIRRAVHEASVAKRLAEWLVQLGQASECASKAGSGRLTASGGHGSQSPNGRHIDSGVVLLSTWASTTAICNRTSLHDVVTSWSLSGLGYLP